MFQPSVPSPSIPPPAGVFRPSVLFAVACGALAGGCDRLASRPDPAAAVAQPLTAPGTRVPPGSLGRALHYGLRVLGVQQCRPEPGGRTDVDRLGVEVAIEATAGLQVPANPYYALLVDVNNQIHEATLGGCPSELVAVVLQPGESTRGSFTFELPRQTQAAALLYAPALASGEREELSLALAP
jgi:hypothetical protein